MKELKEKWSEIVKITDDQKNILQGLRNTLFLDLKTNRLSFTEGIKYLIKILQILIWVPRNIGYKPKLKYLIIFYGYSPANFNNLYPVFREFDDNEVLVLKHKSIPDHYFPNKDHTIDKNKIPYLTSYKERMLIFEAAGILKALLKSSCAIDKNIYDIINTKRLKYLYYIYLILLSKAAADSFLEKSGIKLIITTSDHFPLEYSLISAANILNIPSYVIQHGVLGVSHFPFTSKYLIVWNDHVRGELINKGCKNDSILVAGMPSSDILFRKGININTEKILLKQTYSLLILSDTHGASVYPEIYYQYKEFLRRLIQLKKNYEIIIKLHPAEKIDFYNEFIGDIKILDKGVRLDEALDLCDVSLTIWSTAGLDSMILNKPTFILKVDDCIKEYAWWPDYGGGFYVNSADHLLTVLNPDFLHELIKKQKEFLDNFFPNQGEASNFIYKLITHENN